MRSWGTSNETTREDTRNLLVPPSLWGVYVGYLKQTITITLGMQFSYFLLDHIVS